MRRFEYVRPASLEEAVRFRGEQYDESFVLAGGTAAVTMLAQGLVRPGYVLDLGGIDSLKTHGREDGILRIGALTPIAMLHRDAALRAAFPLLAEAAAQVASIRVRSVATVGGSVCYAEPQSDLPPALVALGAQVEIAASTGTRSMPLQEFFLGPYETALEPGELLAAIVVPAPEAGTGTCHEKFTVGSRANKPVANASCLLRLDGAGRVAEARIVMGAVGGTPILAADAAGVLHGEQPTEAAIVEAARRASLEADPLDDLRGPEWYKRRIVGVLVERGLTCALQRARAAGR